ncbi:type II toxin-antitoxin system RelE/ParE family toxin [Synechocystis salina LEGE 06099]|uniref:type II toxin-antitoxin system RelE family toxin n=1 Tax=Synechocystis salina TaxID=945780 RepID=UPI00187F5206|nr:type II toxin-antitoxin system RelE/ParE family toxin [Synechocystis salina]MBE9202322.1 type II toxin-antitoxin system RelE/ParE family toxin [Synechocystis salina LEGE 06099]
MAWQIEFDPKAVKDLKKLDSVAQRRILEYPKNKVAVQPSPRDLGKALKGDKIGLWRYRVGNYRIICNISDEKLLILVIKVGSRQSVYD